MPPDLKMVIDQNVKQQQTLSIIEEARRSVGEDWGWEDALSCFSPCDAKYGNVCADMRCD